ncbi:hypothetical protein GCM10011381_36240 [Klenkia taihuensis]|nr:hypothetical protein GCM10011381_36240 [Klenkia taihuensis]
MIPVTSSIRSANVDLPWSMWAMMQKFRMRAGSVRAGAVTVLPWSHVAATSWRTTGTRARTAHVVRTAPAAAGHAPGGLVAWRTGPQDA